MYEEEIKRGVELLDRKVPGWLARIDVAMLNMREYSGCVAARAVGGTYGAGLLTLGIDYDQPISAYNDAVRHGFTVVEDGEYDVTHSLDDMNAAYATLTAEWQRTINELRVAASANAQP